jgi:hypothetical protein
MTRPTTEDPETVTLRTGKKLTCAACGGDQFFERKLALTPGGGKVRPPRTSDEVAHGWVCAQCDQIHWFQAEKH